MLTTVIGSYPLSYREMGPDAIKQAVSDQLEAGIDIVSDGQTRFDMIEYFARSIDGYAYNGKAVINGKIGRGHSEVFSADLTLARSLAPRVKGIVTGPVTLVFAARIKSGYQNHHDENVYLDTAQAIGEIAQGMVEAGACSIQIDEPYLSVGAPLNIAKKAIESIAARIKVPVALHVCGRVIQIIDWLLDLKGVSVLSHGFKGEDNQSLLHYPALVASSKTLGLGCVDTKQMRVESTAEIADLIRLAAQQIPTEKLIIHPDCGLRSLGNRNVARAKLKNMVLAAKDF
ncbi:MAG TPA: hypothetical protein VLH15_05995 [Dehalococcoidales bacterium]|nr:hypothetical protein [Dehalococcoidales bacterium]